MELNNPGLFWLSIGVILFVLEMLIPGFVLFFFGIAAWITALACLVLPLTLNTQLTVFLITSLLSLFCLRRIAKKIFIGDQKDPDGDSILAKGGERCVVTRAILPPAEGQIKFAGTFWRASSEEAIAAGDVVEVIHQEELLIFVKKII